MAAGAAIPRMKQASKQATDHALNQVEDGSLGSQPARDLMSALQPRFWFSAHMHTKFAALVGHEGGASTRFLALDKCLPGRHFLQVWLESSLERNLRP